MKKIISISIALVFCINAFAQNKKFNAVMEKDLGIMDTCKTIASWQLSANSFERVSNGEKKEWLAYYYVGFCNLMMAAIETKGDKVDEYCDKADAFVKKADSLNPNNSEVITLKSFAASSRIKVNPMSRGAKYGPEAGVLNDKAIELDPNNPRPYLLKGQALFYTPSAFGGGKDKACPVITEAVKKFEAFKPSGKIMPNWGASRAKMLQEQCAK